MVIIILGSRQISLYKSKMVLILKCA